MRKMLGLLAVGAVLVSGCGTARTTGTSADDRAGQAELAAAPVATVVAVGDIACPPGSKVTPTRCRQAGTAKRALAVGPDRVIALGDEQYQKGRYRSFTHAYAKSWGKLRSITYPVPGNHEYYTPGASGYFRYFKGRQPGSPGWYRRSINGWQLYLLNSNCDQVDCRAERAWFESQLTGHPSTCALMAFHHPRFSSGGEHGSSMGMKPFWNIAYRHGVDVALSGHDHDLERFDPMTPAGLLDPVKGIQQFVSGGGGRSLYPKGTAVAGSEFFRSGFGILVLSLAPTGYSWTFRGIGGRVFDSGSSTCR